MSDMSSKQFLASEEGSIEIGHHSTVEVFGLTFHSDTILATVIAGVIVLGLGFWMRSKVNSRVPSKLQLAWEMLVTTVTNQVEQTLGRVHPFVVPLAITLFAFILVANWLELVPTNHLVPSPSADVNFTYALALVVIVAVHIYSVQQRGAKGYAKHYFQPFPVMAPLNIIDELAKPVSLALRLFGNIFAGGVMIALIGLLPTWILWGPNLAWKMFDMFIGGIQALIFALLTIIYFGLAGDTHDESHDQKSDQKSDKEMARA